MNETEKAMATPDAARLRVVSTSTCAGALSAQSAGGVDPAPSRRGWASVGAIAFGAFVIVMTETLPVGLLPQIADGLDVSLGLAGLMVLVPGFSAAVAAPLFFLGSGRFDRRSVILALGLAVLVSNALVAVAPSFIVALIARLLFGATLGAFWTVVSSVGPKLVGRAAGTRAITIIAAGISGGTVVGLPAGQLLGELFGWRLTFGIATLVTLLVVLAQAAVLPGIRPDGRTHLRDLIGVVTRPAAQFGMGAGALVFVGQFAAWTYITPFLLDHANLPSGMITLLYVIYGCGGIIGSLIAGSLFKRSVIKSFGGAAMVVGALLVGLSIAGSLPGLAGLLVVLWGLFWGVVNPGTLVWILDAAPETPEAASAVNVTNLQVAVAVGSGLGAILVTSTSLQTVFLTGGLIVLASALLSALALRFVVLARRD